MAHLLLKFQKIVHSEPQIVFNIFPTEKENSTANKLPEKKKKCGTDFDSSWLTKIQTIFHKTLVYVSSK